MYGLPETDRLGPLERLSLRPHYWILISFELAWIY